MIIRVFYDLNFETGDSLILDEQESKYLRILRITPAEPIEVFGKNYWAAAEITGINKKGYQLIVKEKFMFEETQPRIIIFQAMPEMKKAEFLTQKCVELGADEIIFF